MSNNLCLKGYGQCPWQAPSAVTRDLFRNIPTGSVKQQALFVLGRYHEWCFKQIDYSDIKKAMCDAEELHSKISAMKDHINNGSWNSLPFYVNQT